MDLRCGSKKHAEIDDGVVRVKCSSRFCGARPGVVVIHHFDALTGEPIKTRVYRDADHREEQHHAASHSVAVRSA